MIRKQVKIDSEKCVGCGACARTCHQSVIEMQGGKAVATKIHACDGLERCLPMCPADAISFELVEVEGVEEVAVEETSQGELQQWPVQIQLVPVQAPYFHDANLLVAADCTAFTYGNFHQDFIRNHTVVIGCPKLDEEDYSIKLAEIIKHNQIQSIQVVRMEVPCCGGLEWATRKAVELSGKAIDLKVITISITGKVLSTISE